MADHPLDDGVRYGPEPWRTLDGVAFCHWDRWLLRLAIAEPRGLPGIAAEFRRRTRARRAGGSSDDSEAMIAQVRDLESRLAVLGRAPHEILDDIERASDWLFKKAFRRVWHDGPNRRTEAMMRTPRRALEARALRGHWPRFPISPATYEPDLRSTVGQDGNYYDYRWAGALATMLESKIEMLAMVAPSHAHRLAIHRAAMTVIIETIDRVDDSGAEVSEMFRATEAAYLTLAREALSIDGVRRDLLELAIWEDYGLFAGVDEFLAGLPEEHADAALRDLASIITELRRERLEYQLGKAIALRRRVMASADHHSPG
jgi:hypothetical protein